MSKLRIACIGSRDIDDKQHVLFKKIGAYIVNKGNFISTGAADGSDFAFMCGGDSIEPAHVIVYLPWKSYNDQYLHPRNKVLFEPKSEWYDLTAPFHPAWDKLTAGGKALMARNYGILNKADKCIALLNHNKSGGGGTGQGCRIAKYLNIPVLYLNDKTFEEVICWLNF